MRSSRPSPVCAGAEVAAVWRASSRPDRRAFTTWLMCRKTGRLLHRQRPEGRRVDLQHPRIVDRPHRGRSRIARQHRHLAEVATSLRSVATCWFEGSRTTRARPSSTTNIESPGCVLPHDGLARRKQVMRGRGRERPARRRVERRQTGRRWPAAPPPRSTSASLRTGSSSRWYSTWIGHGISMLCRRNAYQMLVRTWSRASRSLA